MLNNTEKKLTRAGTEYGRQESNTKEFTEMRTHDVLLRNLMLLAGNLSASDTKDSHDIPNPDLVLLYWVITKYVTEQNEALEAGHAYDFFSPILKPTPELLDAVASCNDIELCRKVGLFALKNGHSICLKVPAHQFDCSM